MCVNIADYVKHMKQHKRRDYKMGENILTVRNVGMRFNLSKEKIGLDAEDGIVEFGLLTGSGAVDFQNVQFHSA